MVEKEQLLFSHSTPYGVGCDAVKHLAKSPKNDFAGTRMVAFINSLICWQWKPLSDNLILYPTSFNCLSMRPVMTITSCSRAVWQSQGQHHRMSQWTPIWSWRCNGRLNGFSCSLKPQKDWKLLWECCVIFPRKAIVICRGTLKMFSKDARLWIALSSHPYGLILPGQSPPIRI